MRKVILFAALLLVCGCNRMVGRGEKVGTIIKLAQEGFWVKTWEGEMIRGGMNSGNGAFSTKPLHFTVMDESLLPKVQAAFDNQKEVIVTYEERLNTFTFTSECNEGCKFLTSIRER
jgi:hypothetical protein